MNTLTADQSEDPTFIHSRVDDLGLTMAEFRVYCHLKRRTNHGTAWPGIDSMARVCRMHKMTAVKAIHGLEERKMVVVTRVEGEGNRYRLTKPSRWVDQSKIDNATGIKEITDQSNLDNGHQPLLDNGRVSILEGNPLKKSPYSPPKGTVVKFESKFCQFWNQLPKANRIGLGKTKEAWNKQLQNGSSPEEIIEGIEKLVKYEKLRKDQDPNGYRALHPTTWLNQERWNDGETMEPEDSL